MHNKNSTKSIPTLSVIGAGKLGKTLAKIWCDASLVSIQQIVNRSLGSTETAINFIGQGQACFELTNLKPVDFLLIAVTDSEIESVAEQLAETKVSWQDSVIFHCSGSLSSQVLKAVQPLQAWIASAHPLYSFANPAVSVSQLGNCFCCAEGDEQALIRLQILFESINMQWQTINADQKLVYHAAAVFACNFLPAIINASHECLTSLGFDQGDINKMLLPLAHQTLNNIDDTSPKSALTGPLQRGDLTLLSNQLAALKHLSPELASFYQTLNKNTLKLTDHSQTSPETFANLQKLFDSNSE